MPELMKQISEQLEIGVEDIRIWSLMTRYNHTVRPLNCFDLKDFSNKTVHDLAKQDSVWNIFVETSNDLSFSNTFDYASLVTQSQPPSPVQSPQTQKLAPYKNDEVMIFFKYYDPKTSTLRYVFRMNLAKTASLTTIQDKINKKMKFPPQTDLLFYEEVKISQITPFVNKEMSLSKLAHEQLLDGDIYVFQINEKEKLQTYKLPTVIDYFKDLSLQVEVLFCDKNQPNDEGFSLVLSLKMKYDEFAHKVGEHLNYDPEKLQFFRVNPNLSSSNNYELKSSAFINQAIKYNPEFQLKDAFALKTGQQFQQQQGQQPQARKLYYQKLNIKIIELEERRPFKLTWLSANFKVEKELVLMPLKKATVKDLLNECRCELVKENLISKEQFEDERNFRLRLVEIVASKLHRIFRDDVAIENLETAQISNKMYRVEQILPEEFDLLTSGNPSNGDDYLLPIAHFSKEIYATFGLPFCLRLNLANRSRTLSSVFSANLT